MMSSGLLCRASMPDVKQVLLATQFHVESGKPVHIDETECAVGHFKFMKVKIKRSAGFLQVRENWKRSGNLSGQGKCLTCDQVRENENYVQKFCLSRPYLNDDLLLEIYNDCSSYK